MAFSVTVGGIEKLLDHSSGGRAMTVALPSFGVPGAERSCSSWGRPNISGRRRPVLRAIGKVGLVAFGEIGAMPD